MRHNRFILFFDAFLIQCKITCAQMNGVPNHKMYFRTKFVTINIIMVLFPECQDVCVCKTQTHIFVSIGYPCMYACEVTVTFISIS